MSNRNQKKTFALLTIPTDEKVLEILTFNDAEIISDNKYSGKDFMEDASQYLFDLKNKNLEGVILDFYCHDDSDFLLKIREYFFEFCESKIILFRLVYQNVIFTSMLLYHSELDFNPDDTVYSIWIKKDNFVSYKLEESTLYFINEMKITDDFAENEEFDKLLDCENPKFLVLGSQLSDVRLKQLKDRFKAQKTKVMYCTYEDCLKKSASHYLSRFIRAKDWRWNFKLSDSTNPENKTLNFPRKKKRNNTLTLLMVLATVALAIGISWYLSANSSPTELSGDSYLKDIEKISKNDKEIYGFLMGVDKNIRLTIYGAQTKHGIGVINRRMDIFLDDFLQIFEHPKFKAVIVQIHELSHYVEWYDAISKLFDIIDMPYIFMEEDAYIYSCLLTGANITVNLGESIRFVMMYPQNSYEIKELQYTDVGYIGNIGRYIPENLDVDFVNPHILRHKVFGTNSPAKIVLYSYHSGTAMMKAFKDTVLEADSEKVIAIEEDYRNFETNFVYEKVKWMFDKSYTKFHIPPRVNRKFMIGFKCGEKDYPLIVCEKNEILPFEKSLVIPRTPFEYFFQLASTNQFDYGQVIQKDLDELKLHKGAHAYQISMEIDIDNFVNTSATTGYSLQLSKFAEILNESFSSRLPVIAFYGDLSFIFIYDKNAGYTTFDKWNGKLGKELYISFDEKNPKYFEKATKVLQSTCSSVVHDIINVMSTSPDEIHSLKPTYGYDLTTDSNNEIWYKFNNSSNGIKKATPTALMYHLLTEHVKAIKRETGVNPDELLFYLFDEFDDAAKNRVKMGLKACCKKLKVECSFIKTLSLPPHIAVHVATNSRKRKNNKIKSDINIFITNKL